MGVPAKEWMEALLAAQSRGEEPSSPNALAMDAGEIRERVPTDRFPGHAAWLDWPLKLHRIEKPGTELRWELYDLERDPAEAKPLDLQKESRRPALQSALDAWLASVARSLNGEDY